MAELLTTASALLTPTPNGPRSADSLDALLLERDRAGRVVASTRPGTTHSGFGAGAGFGTTAAVDVPAHDPYGPTGEAGGGPGGPTAAALALLRRAYATWNGLPAAPLQSAVVRVRERRAPDGSRWRSTGVTARLETVGGPVLVGSGRTGPALPETAVPALPSGPLADTPPASWQTRPLLLAPPVAAQIVTAAWYALTSASGRTRLERLTGARVLPGLGLVDTADEHPPHGTDDAGHPAGDLPVVTAGTLCPLPRDPEDGLLAGRLVWDHDSGRCVPAPHTALVLTGPAAPRPADALELIHCVEGLQRHHADGVLRLLCLARPVDAPDRWSRFLLRGKPLKLLQAVRGATGAPDRVHTDHTVTVPALLLPAGGALAEKRTGSLAHS